MDKRARLGEWLAMAILILGVAGMAVASPPLVGPDEQAHQATANYVTEHILPPKAETKAYTPGIIKFGDCTAFNSELDASCMADRSDISVSLVRVLNYPPPYYWVIGLGQKFAPTADQWMDVGGRIASLVLNVCALLLLAGLMRKHYSSWGSALLAVGTPMAAFMWAVVNPNGWEISSGLIFTYMFARAWWDSDDRLGRIGNSWLAFALVALSAVIFALSRHDAIVWLSLIVLAVLLTGTETPDRIRKLKILAGAGLGLIAGLSWQLFFPAQHVMNNANPILNPNAMNYVHWFGESDEILLDRIQQMVGVVGSLDTPVMEWMVLAVLLGWGFVIGILFARTRIPVLLLALGFFGTVFVPMAMETLRWNDWPYWWNGRITLAFTIPFLLLLLLRYGSTSRRAIVGLSLVTGAVLTYMVWQTLVRYAFGVRNYIPLRGTEPAIGDFWYTVGLVIVILMAIALVARVWWFVRDQIEGNGRQSV